MIENEVLQIKIIYRKQCLKIFQVLKHIFVLQNIKKQFSKIVFENASQIKPLFFKHSQL